MHIQLILCGLGVVSAQYTGPPAGERCDFEAGFYKDINIMKFLPQDFYNINSFKAGMRNPPKSTPPIHYEIRNTYNHTEFRGVSVKQLDANGCKRMWVWEGREELYRLPMDGEGDGQDGLEDEKRFVETLIESL